MFFHMKITDLSISKQLRITKKVMNVYVHIALTGAGWDSTPKLLLWVQTLHNGPTVSPTLLSLALRPYPYPTVLSLILQPYP